MARVRLQRTPRADDRATPAPALHSGLVALGPYAGGVTATHVIISTHTVRHLRATLAGVAAQERRPASVTVSIDTDHADVRAAGAEAARELGLAVLIAWRAYPGQVRVGQVRNNGVRALRSARGTEVREDDWLHFLDGDSAMMPGMLAEAERVREPGDLLIGGRVLLSERQTAGFDVDALRRGVEPLATPLTREQLGERAARHARYARQLLLKRIGLTKMHKPKVLGANHACRVRMFERVDGYDETFLGAWREDDDFGRRVYLAGGRGVVAVRNVCVHHLWHPENPKKRENWTELPEAGERGCKAQRGLEAPADQGPITVQMISV